MIFGYNVEKIRKDFPSINEKEIYLDNACMSLKPSSVINTMNDYYTTFPACAGRSSHALAEKVENALQQARETVQHFLHARSTEEIVFTRNATESINLFARGLALKRGDEVIVSDKEHNSNLIPWIRLVKEKGIVLKVIESNEDNTFSLENLKKKLTSRTKVISLAHTSNLDGVTNPVEEITRAAHAHNALVMIDAAQSAPHTPLDVQKIGCDFLVFSGHKLLGPTGTGVLYGKKESLAQLTPLISGGGTVTSSTYDSFVEEKSPARFEAGLQDYAGIIGLGAACLYLKKIGLKNIEKHEQKLNVLATELLLKNPSIEIIGPRDAHQRAGILSFSIQGLDPLNVARMLSSQKIYVRGGMHCVHSWFNAKKIKGSVRASFYLYTTEEEVKRFVDSVAQISSLVLSKHH